MTDSWKQALQRWTDDLVLVLETAMNGRAALIVTFNQRDFGPAAEQFGIEVLRPGEALMRLENRT